MWLGKWKNKKDTPFGFKWPTEYIHALSVCFSHNQATADSLNFGEKIQNAKRLAKKKSNALRKDQQG